MTIECYTSISYNYLAKARVLGQSVKRFHPDWVFNLVLADIDAPTVDLADEPFDRVITLADLNLADRPDWLFSHNIVELCTAVKGPALDLLINQSDVEAVLYIDPDIALFHQMVPVLDALEDHSVVLTPHQLSPEETPSAIVDNEITALAFGVFNLGFLAVKADAEGKRFAAWWRDRLLEYCYDDRPRGLFTDQRWCDLVPAYFPGHTVLRNTACNVATWNLSHRAVSGEAPHGLLIDGEPLVFYHFTGYDSGAGRRMLGVFAAEDSPIRPLWDWYDEEVLAAGQADVGSVHWALGHFADGVPITQEMRQTYRDRPDVRETFPDPFSLSGERTFRTWWDSHVDEQEVGPDRRAEEAELRVHSLESARTFLVEENNALREQLDEARRLYGDVLGSTSWRVSRPVRAAGKVVQWRAARGDR